MSKFDEAIKILDDLREYGNGDNTFLPITLGEITSIDKALELGKELENENMMLKTKLAMYEQLNEIFNKHSFRLDRMREWTDLPLLESRVLNDIEELLKQIKSLDKKCDGACEI